MAIYTFGIVRADLGRLLPKIAFANDSTPTSAQADSIIEDHEIGRASCRERVFRAV